MSFADTPEPPYYAVIFTSRSAEEAGDDYAGTAARMVELAGEQPGFLGIESTRGEDGVGITVSYWESLEAITAWKQNEEHQAAQRAGREKWYDRYELRIARVERSYGFDRDAG